MTVLALAALTSFLVWENLRDFPRTSDAEIRASSVGISPQVGATITRIAVSDNQAVRKGDLLFEMDARPYEAVAAAAAARLELVRLEVAALNDEVEATRARVSAARERARYAMDHSGRIAQLLDGEFVSVDRVQAAQTEAAESAAAVEQLEAELARSINSLGTVGEANMRVAAAEAELEAALLNVSFCKVEAPCDGQVTDLQITPGAYAHPGRPVMTLVDTTQWWVLANFRETELSRIRNGQPAVVYVMADRRRALRGHVSGVARAVESLLDPSRLSPAEQGVFEDVRPTFDYIILSARFPVRIELDSPSTSLRSGGRASVVIDTRLPRSTPLF